MGKHAGTGMSTWVSAWLTAQEVGTLSVSATAYEALLTLCTDESCSEGKKGGKHVRVEMVFKKDKFVKKEKFVIYKMM